VAEFTELKQQLEQDTLVLSILKKLQEVRRRCGIAASSH